MEKNNWPIIDRTFRKEIGLDIIDAVNILDRGGITPEDLEDITNKFKNMIAEEVEIRKIPYEYRFLMLNVIFCMMFKTTVKFYKEFIDSIKDIKETEDTETE